MPHRFLIAPDPDRPGRFYAEHLVTGERVSVPSVRDARDALRVYVDASPQLALLDTTMVFVEHPTPDEDPVFDDDQDDHPVCLEPGCLTPAPLYCQRHRYQMVGAEF